MGDKLISVNGEDLIIEDYYLELTEEPVSVYNFQVEDFHTYFVGDCAVWVHNAECTIEFDNRSGLDEKEFKQQLKDQQDGLGDLTIDEYQKNRKAYKDRKAQTGNGRDPNSNKYQRSTKKQAISQKASELYNSGEVKTLKDARKMAKEWASGKSALHAPDQIAGGYADRFSGLGDFNINSSIGPQWTAESRIGKLDAYIQEQSQSLPGTTKLSELNIKLELKT